MKTVLYMHGMGGSADEAAQYRDLFDCPVIGVEYADYTPWIAREVLRRAYEEQEKQFDEIEILAVSIGAYFSMLALWDKPVSRAYFVSPIVDMEQLILGWMAAQGVTEKELREKGTIPNRFGEPFSWQYLSFVRENQVRWDAPTEILYGSKDGMMPIETVRNFAAKHHAGLTGIDEEHYIKPDRIRPFLKERMNP